MDRPLRILSIIGARPQIIKAAALSRAVAGPFAGRIRETLLHTGQHYDQGMSQVFHDELGIPEAAVQLAVGSGSHGDTTARMLQGIERELLRGVHDMVLVYGDTNSTLAGALAAAKLRIPIAHVEAGLRSFDKRMPEEVNRIIVDHCSTWLFCPTRSAVDNLMREGFLADASQPPGINAPHVVACGDVMYDNSLHFSALAGQRSTLLAERGLEGRPYALITVHRDHNTDDPERLRNLVQGFLELHASQGIALVWPMHPRARRQMEALLPAEERLALQRAAGIHLLPPVGFLDMIALEKSAALVLTDSGGVQKEAYFFGRPCVILRPNTEWVELVAGGQAMLADTDPERILAASTHLLDHGIPSGEPLFGDGHAAETICEHLLRYW
ncbi:MAG: UDP-N-acetylglucosamine 2-epimerase (non-hydrolyzing) [Flavobacteriales bacterium]